MGSNCAFQFRSASGKSRFRMSISLRIYKNRGEKVCCDFLSRYDRMLSMKRVEKHPNHRSEVIVAQCRLPTKMCEIPLIECLGLCVTNNDEARLLPASLAKLVIRVMSSN